MCFYWYNLFYIICIAFNLLSTTYFNYLSSISYCSENLIKATVIYLYFLKLQCFQTFKWLWNYTKTFVWSGLKPLELEKKNSLLCWPDIYTKDFELKKSFCFNPLSAKKSKKVQSESDRDVSARLAFRLCRPLSLLNFTHLWFRFQTCFHVFMWYTPPLVPKGLKSMQNRILQIKRHNRDVFTKRFNQNEYKMQNKMQIKRH